MISPIVINALEWMGLFPWSQLFPAYMCTHTRWKWLDDQWWRLIFILWPWCTILQSCRLWTRCLWQARRALAQAMNEPFATHSWNKGLFCQAADQEGHHYGCGCIFCSPEGRIGPMCWRVSHPLTSVGLWTCSWYHSHPPIPPPKQLILQCLWALVSLGGRMIK